MKTLIFALCVLCSSVVIAAETESEKSHEGEESHGKHALAVIVGVTVEGDEDLGTLGIEYSYRLHKYWSVGGVIERAEREKDSTLVIAFVHLWPYKGWFLGPGSWVLGWDERIPAMRGRIPYELQSATSSNSAGVGELRHMSTWTSLRAMKTKKYMPSLLASGFEFRRTTAT